MALSVATGVSSVSAANSTTTITVGFRPTGIVAWTTDTSTAGAITGGARLFMFLGYAVGNSFYGGNGGVSSQNNVETSNALSTSSIGSTGLSTHDHTGTLQTAWYFTITNTGMTVTASGPNLSTVPRFHWMLLGGDARCYVAQGNIPSFGTTTSQSITANPGGGGFIPTAAIRMATGNVYDPAGALYGATMSVSSGRTLSDGNESFSGNYFEIRDGAGTSNTSALSYGSSIVSESGAFYITIDQSVQDYQQLSTPVTFTKTTSSGDGAARISGRFFHLLIGDVAAREKTASPLSTSTTFTNVTPKAVFATSTGNNYNAVYSIGAATSANQSFAAIRDRDARDITEAHRVHNTNGYLGLINLAANTMGTVVTRSTLTTSLQSTLATGSTWPTGVSLLALGDLTFNLSGTASGGATASAVRLTMGRPLIGTITGGATASASILGRAFPSATGTLKGESSATASFVPLARLDGTTLGKSLITGFMSGVALLSGSSAGAGSVSGIATILRPVVPLSGVARGNSGHYVWLGPVALFSGTTAGAGVVIGSGATPSTPEPPIILSCGFPLTGTTTGGSDIDSRLRMEFVLLGDVAGDSFAAAPALAMDKFLSGTAAGDSIASLSIDTEIGLSGVSTGSSTARTNWVYPLPYLFPPGPREVFGTINLVANPSLEYDLFDLDGWGGTGLSRVNDESWDGNYYGYVTLEPGDSVTVTVDSQHNLFLAAGASLLGSISIQSTVAGTVRLVAYQTDTTTVIGDTVAFDPATSWQRINAPFIITDAELDYAVLEIAFSGPTEGTGDVRLDAAQIEQDFGGGYTPFASGDMGGSHAWSGPFGFSPSVRQPESDGLL